MAWHVYMVFKRVLIINLSELAPRGDQSSYKENSTVNPVSPSIKIQIPIILMSLYVSYKSSNKKLLKYQLIVSCVIISLILITNLS